MVYHLLMIKNDQSLDSKMNRSTTIKYWVKGVWQTAWFWFESPTVQVRALYECWQSVSYLFYTISVFKSSWSFEVSLKMRTRILIFAGLAICHAIENGTFITGTAGSGMNHQRCWWCKELKFCWQFSRVPPLPMHYSKPTCNFEFRTHALSKCHKHRPKQ